MIRQTRLDVPRLRGPAAVNAAQYWLAPDRFARRCERLGDRFQVAMPATGPWLCLTHPDDIKRVFLADPMCCVWGCCPALNVQTMASSSVPMIGAWERPRSAL